MLLIVYSIKQYNIPNCFFEFEYHLDQSYSNSVMLQKHCVTDLNLKYSRSIISQPANQDKKGRDECSFDPPSL